MQTVNVLPGIKERKLPSIARRLVVFLLPKAKAPQSSDSSYSLHSPPAPLSPSVESPRPRLSLTSLSRPLLNLLEIRPPNGGDVSSMPLLAPALKACYEDPARMAAISKLNRASAVELAEVTQSVCDLSYFLHYI